MKLLKLTFVLLAGLCLAACTNDKDDLLSGTIEKQEAVRDTDIKTPFINYIRGNELPDYNNKLYYKNQYSGLEILFENVYITVNTPDLSDTMKSWAAAVRVINGDGENIILPQIANMSFVDSNGDVNHTTYKPMVIGWRYLAPFKEGIPYSFKRMYVPKQYKVANTVKGDRPMDAKIFMDDFTDNMLEYIYIDTDYNDPVQVCSINGALYSFDMKTFQLCPIGRKGHLVLAEGTEVIAAKSFAKCLNLNAITIPASIKKIEANAISNTPKLKVINILAITPPEVEANAFGPYVLTSTIRVPAGSEEAYRNAPGFSACKKIEGYNF